MYNLFQSEFRHTQTEVIAKQLAHNSSTGKEQTEFLESVITEFENSENRQFMDVAWRYYLNKNDVMNDKRTVIGRDGQGNAVLMESKVLSNNKLSHNFLKKLTRQKIAYMLGKPFMLSADKDEDDTALEFFSKCEPYFNSAFYKMLKNVGRDSIVKGIAWMHVYYNEEGELKFMRCAPEEIIPFWADSDHTELDAVVRQYSIERYTGGDKKLEKHVDYYTKEGIYHYIYDGDGRLKLDPEYGSPSSHFNVATEEGEKVGVQWKQIPFVAFKFDPDEQTLLARVKTLIDDYDRKTSFVSNNIDDFPNAITVVKNYDGESKEEFVANKNEYRTIFVQNDGGAETLETPLNITEIDVHIQRLREDIYEFAQGVNTADKDIRDTSGVALRFMYADLDMDCIDWGSEVDAALCKIIWFIQQDLIAKGEPDYTPVRYSIIFNTDIIVNETETITNAFTSVGVISDETIAANHPWTKSAEKEINKMKEDMKDDLSIEQEFGTPTATAPAKKSQDTLNGSKNTEKK